MTDGATDHSHDSDRAHDHESDHAHDTDHAHDHTMGGGAPDRAPGGMNN